MQGKVIRLSFFIRDIHMLGSQKMTYGLLLCVVGAAILAGGQYKDLPEFSNYIGYGVLGVGALLFVLGILFGFVHQATDGRQLHHDDAAVSAMALIRCMIAVSVADGHLDDSEIATTAKIYRQLTGSAMDEQTIRDAADEMKAQGASVSEELANIKSILNGDLRRKIVKASLFILAADGHMDEKEEEILEDIRKGLGMSSMKFNAMKQKFLESKDLS